MKQILNSLLFLSLLVSLDSFGQNPISVIDSNFSDLKYALNLRNDVVNNFTIILSESSREYPNQIKSILGYTNELKQYILSMSVIDSSSLSLLYLKSTDLTETIRKILNETEYDKNLKENEYFVSKARQLEGSENRVFIERMLYNEKCKEFNRIDLFFGPEIVE